MALLIEGSTMNRILQESQKNTFDAAALTYRYINAVKVFSNGSLLGDRSDNMKKRLDQLTKRTSRAIGFSR
jgi:hypothetical protein